GSLRRYGGAAATLLLPFARGLGGRRVLGPQPRPRRVGGDSDHLCLLRHASARCSDPSPAPRRRPTERVAPGVRRCAAARRGATHRGSCLHSLSWLVALGAFLLGPVIVAADRQGLPALSGARGGGEGAEVGHPSRLELG